MNKPRVVVVAGVLLTATLATPARGLRAAPEAVSLLATDLVRPELLIADENWLYLLAGESPTPVLYRVSKTGGAAPERLADLTDGWTPACGVAQDAQRLYLVTGSQTDPDGGGGAHALGGLGEMGTMRAADPSGRLVGIEKSTGKIDVEMTAGPGPCQVGVAGARVVWSEGSRGVRSSDRDGSHKQWLFKASDEGLTSVLFRGGEVFVLTDKRLLRLDKAGAAPVVLAQGELLTCSDFLDDGRIAFWGGNDVLLAVAADGSGPAEKLAEKFHRRCGRIIGPRLLWITPRPEPWGTPGRLSLTPLAGDDKSGLVVHGIFTQRFVADEGSLYLGRQTRNPRRADIVRLDRANLEAALGRLIAEDDKPWPVVAGASPGKPPARWKKYRPGVRSTNAVRDALDSALPELADSCIMHLAPPPVASTVGTTMSFVFLIEADGRVAEAVVTASGRPGDPLASCISKRARSSLRFSASPLRQLTRVSYTLGSGARAP